MLEAFDLDHLPRTGVIALGTIEAPTDELVQALARLVPNGAPRRAYGTKGHPHLRRNFLLAVSTVAGAAQRGAPHVEATHAALSNISHAIVGHHHAMLEADAQWHALHEQARSIALHTWSRMNHDAREAWVAHHHQLKRKEGNRLGCPKRTRAAATSAQ